jgi:hypothetical protein
MVSVLGSSAVDRGFEPRSGQTNDYKIGMCCFSAKHADLIIISLKINLSELVLNNNHSLTHLLDI